MVFGRIGVWAGMFILSAGLSWADAPRTSLRPMPRPTVAVPVVPALVEHISFAPTGAILRPRARPASLNTPTPARIEPAVAQVAPAPLKRGLFGFMRPRNRPDGLTERKLVSAGAVRVLPGKQAVVSKKGSVCGVPDIKGATLARIPGKIKGCGIDNPVSVTSVGGVRLSTPATVNCSTAKALNTWVKRGLEPVYGRGQVVEMTVFASYACRGRNNKKGARISEHGRGNAIDIGGLVLANGKSVSVLHGFDKSMRRVHKAACGIFGTTLGPGSDGYHENHMHFDVARYRGGSYCR